MSQRGTLCDRCGTYVRGWWHTPEGDDLCEACMYPSPRPLEPTVDLIAQRPTRWAKWRDKRQLLREERRLIRRYRWMADIGPGSFILPEVNVDPDHLPPSAAIAIRPNPSSCQATASCDYGVGHGGRHRWTLKP